jgi:HNH endonuclease
MKKIRFEVFKRDAFTCQYCGRRPPEAILHADHIVPKAKGGIDESENLITACADCNSGKGARSLTEPAETVQRNIAQLQEKKKQLEAFNEYQRDMQMLTELAVDDVASYWGELWDQKYSLNACGRASIKSFLKIFTTKEINPTTTSLFDMRVTTRYVAPAYPRAQQEAAHVTSQSDRW